jgi:predicted nucleotide-binding protein
MARLDERLLTALENKLGLSRSQINRRIAQEAAEGHLPRKLAAISLAAKNKLPFNRFATADELAELRGPATRIAAPAPVAAPTKPPGKKLGKTKAKATKDNSMFVVHGRDAALNRDMYAFLSSIGIVPLEWDQATAKGGANPNVGDVISQAMDRVQGVMVLFSPDEEAKVRTRFASTSDKNKGLHLKGFQPRPNVIFEAGLALGAHSNKTILVQVGTVREISDIAGRHMVHLSDSFTDRKRLADRLSSKLGFKVDLDGTTWQSIGDFDRD